ncbi:amino acid permease [Flexivirga caeni]|uniref:Amino acid permease n=1 Tax=Flexivirga caeni TaxID=2294115 RepID=A0A3M9LVS3_9MICO|nr:amino acid permease [Flexivirga caeni]RNI17045.1 amino acid permease [Flexivirga caeni]
MPEAHEALEPLDDEDQLAKLGYKQELARTWSGFSNFAISFSIISILAGCLTTYGAGIGNGGPVSISWSWPIISAFIMIIGLTMSELVSSMPTSGGIYFWASKLGGPRAGFFTGWLNLIGLIAVTASVAYSCATFFDLTFQTWGWYSGTSLSRIFLYFLVILVFIAGVNIFSSHLLALLNNISVWWHVVGALLLIAVLIFVPKDHLSFHQVFLDRFNGSGWSGGSTSSLSFWLAIIPFGFILTQYTITGFDASVHLSEETQGAAKTAAKGIWQSILYSAIGGYLLLLAVTFAIPKVHGIPQYAQIPAGGVQYVFMTALGSKWAGLLLFISSAAQLFCCTACLTSTSRMMFAFSRDRAIPGSRMWSKVNEHRTPVNAVICAAVIGAIITLPALKGVGGIPTAFYAVTSVSVIGLYFSFAIPIFLRWKHGEKFDVGSGWSNGRKYKWMNPVAVIEIIVVGIMLMLPTAPAGAPWRKEFSWSAVNYAPFMTVGVLIILAIWWMASAKNWFKGPVRTVDDEETPVPVE